MDSQRDADHRTAGSRVFRLEVPRLDVAANGGTLIEWLVDEGDSVSYGDAIFRVRANEFLRMSRSLNARVGVLGRGARKDSYRALSGVAVDYEVMAVDAGRLARKLKPIGSAVSNGDLIGVLAVGDDAVLLDPTSWERAPVARVLASRSSDVSEDGSS